MKENTISTIRDACNQLVYTWRRSYNKSIEKNKAIPKPLSIPIIAKKAGIAPKTIYTNSDYKSIALTAIAKTQVNDHIEYLDIHNVNYTQSEVKSMIIDIMKKNETKLKNLENLLVKKVSEMEKLRKENESLEEMNSVYLLKIVELESENAILKGQIDLLNKQ
ncbi:hypothetical protein [Alkaliphilus peptidifermentans]|uniref:Uncharacterized protein n=1 Tax=Alkaliphilus peptidifermentans DSM 18978 TaxID=1120976 RepID=A0A1G5JIY3_9FIRM|nr:hypothetical protein [Alkaliphilus peptidifermentans]SCY87719.1 hypothetical protein SAMN03080606_02864 [Alkaliphilus peptidifermentans DSM 18978]